MHQDAQASRYSSSRIESLTDGIFAFAMTLLVINLSAPVIHGVVTNQELLFDIEVMSTRFFSFLLSFFLLAAAWGVHHRQFSFITSSDTTLMWINMVRLLFVIMVPFSSVLVGNYPELPISAFFFSMNIFFLCLFSFIEWKYAVRHGMVEGMTQGQIHSGDIKNIFPIIVAGVSSVCALFAPEFSLWLYLAIPVGLFVLNRTGRFRA